MKQRKPIILYYILLNAFTLLVLFLPLGQGKFFGSEGDWYVQHVGAAEAIRQTMLSNHTIFPQFIELGAGSNIYDFAYYGLFRPDVLFSCLITNIGMKYIVAVYAILGVLASVSLCFYWLRKQEIAPGFAFFGSALMATSACFFQAHHQVMFVNYLPFLILAFIGTDKLLQKGKIWLLTVALFFIYIHSFFYSPACLFVCLLYFLYNGNRATPLGFAPKGNGFLWGKWILAVGVSILMAAALLLPTALDILSTSKDGGVFSAEPIKAVDLTMSGLLYSPYGCGLTFVALICLLVSLHSKKRRWLSLVILLCMLLPIVSLVLNGFLYARGKILIPFLPLVIMICADTTQDLLARFSYKKVSIALVALLLPSMAVSFIVNNNEDYIFSNGIDHCPFSNAEILNILGGTNSVDEKLCEDNLYRFDVLTDGYMNSNLLPRGDIGRTSMYSSISNSYYANFCYEAMRNPISSRNKVALVTNKNPCFNYFMGIKYVVCHKNNVPTGYETIYAKGNYVIAENHNVLPKCYGTSNLMSYPDYQKLAFPDTLGALCTHVVVNSSVLSEGSNLLDGQEQASRLNGLVTANGNGQALFHEIAPDQSPDLKSETLLRCATKSGYEIDLKREQNFAFPLDENLKEKVLVIKMHVEDPEGGGVIVTVDGMKNCLSSKYAPYPNGNNDFTFVIPVGRGQSELEVGISKGNYIISNLRLYAADMWSLTHENYYLPESPNDFSDTLNAFGSPFANELFSGKINMEASGYFVTSYPYKDGYTAWVDGKQVQCEKVNTAFIGFPLSFGVHNIVIEYEAPGFMPGLIISILGLLAFALLIYKDTKMKGNEIYETHY